MCNKYENWFDDGCKHEFDLNQMAHLRWTRYFSRVNCAEFVHCQMRANEVYSQVLRQFSVRNNDVLVIAHVRILQGRHYAKVNLRSLRLIAKKNDHLARPDTL